MKTPRQSVFVPKLWTVLRNGYRGGDFRHDTVAGSTVAIVSLPLAMALVIASGTTPDKVPITAVLAGFLVSARYSPFADHSRLPAAKRCGPYPGCRAQPARCSLNWSISRPATCSGVTSSSAHSRSNTAKLLGSTNTVRRAVRFSRGMITHPLTFDVRIRQSNAMTSLRSRYRLLGARLRTDACAWRRAGVHRGNRS